MAEEWTKPEDIVGFWREAGQKRWFKTDPEFDALIRERFLKTHEQAAAGKLAHWEETAKGALALVILLDQFSRNMFRGEARAFASDARARAIAERAIARGFDRMVPFGRNFFYLPYMHSENLADQDRCIALFEAAGDAESVKHAKAHHDLIRRFGRFPFRNESLGRTSTPEEKKYLASGGYRV
jgi:uncharacterized protein (DUF924 family)